MYYVPCAVRVDGHVTAGRSAAWRYACHHKQTLALRIRRSVTLGVTGVTTLTRKGLPGSSLAQVCDERATFFSHGSATFMA
jgi:hypothetical protein